jgi:hypothetical protein
MDYVYSVNLSSYIASTTDDNSLGRILTRCSLSNRNILAFSNDCSLFILPLEKPNELIPLQGQANSQCTNLCWSEDGQYLLSVYQNQTVNLSHIKVYFEN